MKCELDTGSKISAINEECYKQYFSSYRLYKDDIKLCSYSGSLIETLGYILVDICINETTEKQMQLYVI